MTAKPTFVTPKGTAAYPYITKADFQYNADGVFKTKLRVAEAEAADLITAIEEVVNDNFGSKAKAAKAALEEGPRDRHGRVCHEKQIPAEGGRFRR